MNPLARYAAYVVLGLLAGATAVITTGIGYAIHDWQTATRRTHGGKR